MSSFSERGLIADIRRKLQMSGHRDLIKGVGDDCAVLRRDDHSVWLVSVDTLVENIHFDCTYHPAELLGRKTASVNISDIAAMGGRADFMLLSVALTENCSSEWVDDFFRGVLAVSQEHRVVLVGGDTVKSGEQIVLSVTIIGSSPEKQVIYRSGTEPGDLVWVSGYLGEAAAGLELCKRCQGDLHSIDTQYEALVTAHLNPSAQLALGQELGKSGLIRSMIDISDGPATDLAHICKESGVGASVMEDKLPLSDALRRAAEFLKMSPVELALSGGEDYQLLFSSPPANEQQLLKSADTMGVEIHCVGSFNKGRQVILAGEEPRDITFQGYEHFSVKENNLENK